MRTFSVTDMWFIMCNCSRGSDNVIGIDLCLRQDDCVVFIMPYLPHKRFSVSFNMYMYSVFAVTVEVLHFSVIY
jgi:hypothetical protein